jgi:hypothetical protein
LRRCAKCGEQKDREEFGRVSERSDGLNIYCKTCVRAKVAKYRANLRAMHRPVNQPKYAPRKANAIARIRRFGAAAQRVYEAIKGGAVTQREIARITKLSRDEVADAIAELLLWKKAIGTKLEGEARRYFIKAA